MIIHTKMFGVFACNTFLQSHEALILMQHRQDQLDFLSGSTLGMSLLVCYAEGIYDFHARREHDFKVHHFSRKLKKLALHCIDAHL